MNSNKQKWVADVESYADGVPFGKVLVEVERVDRRTVAVTTLGLETLRYTNNDEALADITAFIKGLLADGHTGDVQFGIDTKQGQITLLTIKNTRKTAYQK